MKLSYESFEQELFFRLPTGDARSIKSLEFTTELFRLIEVPKAYIDDFGRIYSDIGSSVYIFLSQESKEVLLTTHFTPKNSVEWDVCLVATFSTNKMNRAFAEYLEYLVFTLIEQGGRYSVKNKHAITEPKVTEGTKRTCEAKISFLNILLTALRFDLFSKTEQKEQAQSLPTDDDKKSELTTAMQAEVKKEQEIISTTPTSSPDSLVNSVLTSVDSPAPTNFSYGNNITYKGSVLKKATEDAKKTQDSAVVKNQGFERKKLRKTGYKRSVFNDLYFICQNEDYNAYAIATYNPDTNEMTVLEGSKFSLVRPNTSLPRGYENQKYNLIKSGKLIDKGGYLELTQDHIFSSPSPASSIILNHAANAKHYWRTSRDCKLGDYINNLIDEKEDDSIYKPSHLKNKVSKEPSNIENDKTKPSSFFCQKENRNVFAEGVYDPNTKRITVKKGSTFSLTVNNSLIGGQAEREKKKMIREGVLVLEDDHYTLTEDYVFRNVSRASKVVNGSGGSRRAWINKDGLNISNYYYDQPKDNKRSFTTKVKPLSAMPLGEHDYVIDNNARGVYAVAHYNPEKSSTFTVRKGSTFRLKSINCLDKSRADLRRRLIDNHTLVEQADYYLLASDYVFNSPSQAADIILGGGGSKKHWLNKYGKTL